MTTRLVDTGWGKELIAALHADAGELRIICPFIKAGALDRLLASHPKLIRVITRFNLADFTEGVSDIAALRKLLGVGAHVRGVRNLHAKVYVFGTSRAIVTSANLTQAALNRNHEFGMVSDDAAIVATCRAYFDDLWDRSGADLASNQLDAWDKTVTRCQVSGARPEGLKGLGDYGTDAGITPPPPNLPSAVADTPQAFVKFLGDASSRVSVLIPSIEEIDRAGCHWAVAYPASKRPTGVKDGALIFMGRLTNDPNDIRVFGRAIGLRHVPGRDDATREDIAHRDREWKADWPRYIRVHDAKFVAGTMANGISLNEPMGALGANAFASTQRNAARGEGNTDPRRAYRQQAAVELSGAGLSWLSERLQAAFEEHGTVPQDTLNALDWPTIP